jgi:hypothetical protein
LLRLAVLNEYKIFEIARTLCADIVSGTGAVVRDTTVACSAFELHRKFERGELTPASLVFVARVYRQLIPPLRTFAQAVHAIANHQPAPIEGAHVSGLSKGVVFQAGPALFTLQSVASVAGAGVAKCLAEHLDPLAADSIALLNEPSLLCAYGAYDTAALFDRMAGPKNYPDVCRLLCASEMLMFEAASSLQGPCTVDYQVQDEVVDAALLWCAADRVLNSTSTPAAQPGARSQLTGYLWASALVANRSMSPNMLRLVQPVA